MNADRMISENVLRHLLGVVSKQKLMLHVIHSRLNRHLEDVDASHFANTCRALEVICKFRADQECTECIYLALRNVARIIELKPFKLLFVAIKHPFGNSRTARGNRKDKEDCDRGCRRT